MAGEGAFSGRLFCRYARVEAATAAAPVRADAWTDPTATSKHVVLIKTAHIAAVMLVRILYSLVVFIFVLPKFDFGRRPSPFRMGDDERRGRPTCLMLSIERAILSFWQKLKLSGG